MIKKSIKELNIFINIKYSYKFGYLFFLELVLLHLAQVLNRTKQYKTEEQPTTQQTNTKMEMVKWDFGLPVRPFCTTLYANIP